MTPEEARANAARRAIQQRRQAAATPDGRATAPGTSPEAAARIPQGMVFDPQTGGYVDTALAAERRGPAMGAVGNFLTGGMFVGEGIDEVAGQVGGPIARETARQSVQQFRENRPVAATAAQLTGGVLSALPFAGPGARAVSALPGVLPKAAAAVGGGAVAGGLEGASQGYLSGTTPEDRRERAVTGGVIGSGLGAGAGTVGLGLGALGKAAAQRIKRLDLDVIADEFGVDRKAAQIIKRALVNDDLDAAQEALQRAGDDAMLADAGRGTASLLDAAAQTGGAPLRVAREAVNARARAAQPKIVGVLDDVLGDPTGRRAAATAIRQRTARARQQAYDAAYGAAIDYADDAGRQIESVLERVAPRTMRSAINEANDAMRDAGVRNMQIMAEIADDGSVTFREMPNVQQLDYLKRALDDIARKGTDPATGQMEDAARRAANQAKSLRDAVAEAVPEYRRALKIGGDTIAERDALEMGRRLMSEHITVEDVAETVRGASDAQKKAIRQGLRQDLEKRMGAVRATMTDNAVDARQAVKATLDTSSENVRKKLMLALGPDYNKFSKGMDQASAALELRAAMAANSATAIRKSIQKGIDEVMEPNAVQALLRAEPQTAAQKTVQAATGFNELPSVQREAVLERVAQVLTGVRGDDAQKALQVVRRAMEGQPVSDAQANLVGRVVGSGAFISAHQGSGQALQR